MDPQTVMQDWHQSLDILDDVGLLSFQDSVLDNPPIPTRAGLYICLNAMLYDRPSFDDNTVIDFLNARYKEDVSNLATDLILASFDVLANAMYRNESTRSINNLRSFLVNKLPVFLQRNYAALIFEPMTVEQCIRQALVRVDPAAFPSFSQTFDPLERNSLLSEARQEFLFACALHQMIPERIIEEILGEVPMQSLPASGRYSKVDLVNQCTTNPAKIDEYIGELENMEGNAGEIAGALIEILHALCVNNDTLTLKTVCNALCRKATALDVIMLFTSSNHLLQPLCSTLDKWQDHEDQGEYQPVYDEFGSILLFVVLVQHRFGMQPDEMGVEGSESFVLKYLKHSSVSRCIDDLSEHENQLLGGWIRGLFETEGISDELMSMCKPQEFHLLVATLFEQSLKACQANVLALETLRGGFEYLLEPFLLPSLIAGFTWFTNCLWEMNDESKNIDTVLPALQTLLKPPSMSHDSLTIHNAVLSIVAKPLSDSLTHVQRQYASRPDITPLFQVLNEHFQERQGTTALNELASWSTTPHGGLLAALRQTIQSLILWNATSTGGSPPSYTHRQLADTLRILGAQPVLRLLLDEATERANSDIGLDVITMMILTTSHPAFPPASSKRHLTLRDVLEIEFQTVDDLSRSDAPRASAIVRLHRRAEALSASKTDAAGAAENEFMAGVARNGEPAAVIDDVLGEAENDIATAQEYLDSGNAALLGLA
ncbi:mediator complex, subunit Med5 [Usnea florida]